MKTETLLGRLEFLKQAGQLKDTLRSAFTMKGAPESTAEHTWRLCLWVLTFQDQLDGIDIERLLKLCVVHDLGEAIRGDIPATHQTANVDKSQQEREDLGVLLSECDRTVREEIFALWEEYEAASTPEAILVKGFDKLETLMTHNQGRNPDDFDYWFNMDYGKAATGKHPLVDKIRQLIDKETLENHEVQKQNQTA